MLNNLDVNEQVSVFEETIMNIMSDFVLNELITCNNQDPQSMNCYTKNLTMAISDFHKKYCFPFQQYWQSFNI